MTRLRRCALPWTALAAFVCSTTCTRTDERRAEPPSRVVDGSAAGATALVVSQNAARPFAMTSSDDATAPVDAGSLDAGPLDAADGASVDSDPMDLHVTTKEALRGLFEIKKLTEKEQKVILPEHFLSGVLGVDGPAHTSQGNRAVAQHTISRERCLRGLSGVVIQTAEQREKCGAENMVPVSFAGKPAWFCVDVFEFPNKACELPFVWVPPTYAKKMCELQGKRLCTQGEWSLACRGDPDGAPDRRYAYGETLDLDVCHTNRGHRTACSVRDAKTAWATCATDTEPSGALPRCRSRFGVFDQHGNVAEILTRKEADGSVVSQLKGSAWFYRQVAREPDKPPKPGTTAETYPDHCNFDPRWHVEPIENAWHVNYHLGFRCCKTIP